MSGEARQAVLVVDDEAPMRAFLEKLLAKKGYAVTAVDSGQAALTELGRRPYDVVALDFRMPGMNGAEALSRIRTDHPGVAVIIMTAYPSEESVVRCMGQGAVRFLIKPFTSGEFLRAVAGATHDRRAAATESSLTVRSGFRDWVELTAPSRQEYLARFENFVDALYDTRLAPSDKEDIKIAVSEIVGNAMEWGNKGDQSRKVTVSYCLFPEEIVFKIEDEGEGFAPSNIPDPSGNPVEHLLDRLRQGKRVGGYGLHIARKVMDKVVHNEKGNVVILSKRLSAQADRIGGKTRTRSAST
ncbi:MAG TPA: response regulator [Planctomycetota bacterium]|nr:response regulator [Planctomycetota bacterium]